MSKAKPGSSAPAADKQAELRKKIEYQVACEERAHRIVERLIDNPVAEQMLLDCLHYITTSHYEDIVVERAVSKLCGYPLCPNTLDKVLKQKYMISTKTNKVYDLEARKNFCSNKCYKASLFLEKQVFTDPLWSRKSQQPRKYELFPLDMPSGKVGDEIIVSKAGDIKREIEKLSKLEKYEAALQEKLQQREQTLSSPRGENSETGVGTKTRPTKKNIETEDWYDSPPADNSETENVYTLHKAMTEMKLEDTENEVVEEAIKAQYSEIETVKENSINKPDQVINEEMGNRTEEECSKVNQHLENKVNTEKPDKLSKVPKSKKVTQSSAKAKTAYLMQLLDKKKHLLSKMADIQPNRSENNEQMQTESTGNESDPNTATVKNTCGATVMKKLIQESNVKTGSENCALVTDGNRKSEIINPSAQGSKNSEEFERRLKATEDEIMNYEQKTAPKVVEKMNDGTDNGKLSLKAEVKNKLGQKGPNRRKQKSCTTKIDQSEIPKVTTLELICENIRSWITQETADYLQSKNETDEQTEGLGKQKSEFDKQYEALVGKVDAQEKDFEHLLGEESLEEDSANQMKAPLPHFDILREEAEEERQRISQFMKGTFTYKIQERTVNTKEENITNMLPTLDRYDQMLIRQKIVLDQLSRVLPDLLSPLHLLIQDVFTEMRELVFTFNLTKDNIIHKPAEWTIVALVLLRMLSHVLPPLDRSFRSPGCERVFTILLAGINSNMDSLQFLVDNLLKQR